MAAGLATTVVAGYYTSHVQVAEITSSVVGNVFAVYGCMTTTRIPLPGVHATKLAPGKRLFFTLIERKMRGY